MLFSVDLPSVYPNPASQLISLDAGSWIYGSLDVFDVAGRVLVQKSALEARTVLNIASWKSGIYLFVVSHEMHGVKQLKLMVD